MPGTSRPWRRVGAQARYGEGRRAGKDATWPEHSAYLLRGDPAQYADPAQLVAPLHRRAVARARPSDRMTRTRSGAQRQIVSAGDAGSPDGGGYWVIDIEPCPILTGGNVTELQVLYWARALERLLAVTFSGVSLVLGWNLFRVGILSDQQAQLRADPEASGPRHPREGAGRAPALSSGALAP